MDALTRFLKDCGMVEVKKEYKYWDPARVGKDGSRRVPDVTCVNPNTSTEYVLDARIYWNSMSNGPTGYTAYRHEGWGAEHGEAEKNSSWGEAIARRQEESVHNVLNSFRSVWRQEEFGDLLRRSFSSNALLKRTTKTEMWIYITGLRRSLSRRGAIQSQCW